MFDPTHFLLIHGQDPKKWAARYGIDPCEYPCDYCKKIQKTTIPFACGQFRGLIAERCCDERQSPLYCFVRDPKYGDLFSGG